MFVKGWIDLLKRERTRKRGTINFESEMVKVCEIRWESSVEGE